MQIYAFNTQGTLLHVSQANRQAVYLCPECHREVRLRGGSLRRLHFYHPDATNCHLHGKSLTHLHIQYALQKMLTPETIFLEHRFPKIGRIADVVWPSKKLIFEIQVSPISREEVLSRNQDYRQEGYQVIWVLHDHQFNRFHLTDAEAHLRFSPHYFTNINAFGKGIFYDQYSFIRHRRRLKKTPRLPLLFKKVVSTREMQHSRQIPFDRKKWPIFFEGDLCHQGFTPTEDKKNLVSYIKIPLRLYRIILHLLLEKTTY